ncbi:MAG TPA: rhomboid family intramembrane serine protease [Thermohalobaculum sp.]|nr:rhomboid family intramembrane serine protease [Thermohalobaculum sp.]
MPAIADTAIEPPPPRYSALGAWLILAAMVGVELYIQVGARDSANWSQFRFQMMTEYGFIDRRFDAWLAGGSSQGLLGMFVTYLFVHAGPLHLAVNGALLVFVAPFLCVHIGAVRLLILFVLCGFTGGIAFGLTNDISGPLVGGSAAIMGMLWAVKYWEFRWIRYSGDHWTRYILSILFLIALNVMMHWLSDGGVATEAHIGGGLGGILAARFLSRNPPHGRFFL